MTLNAVQVYVKGVLNGLSTELYTGLVNARIAVPSVDNIDPEVPQVFIWGGAGHEQRTSSGPRGAGWKESYYTLQIYVFALDLPTDTTRDSRFPVLIGDIRKALRSASPMPVQLTDLVTGEIGDLMNLGEDLSWEYDVDRTTGDKRVIRSLCRIEASALEEFPGA